MLARYLVCFLLIASLASLGKMASAVERPNILLVMADDQGWGDMAYNGHPVLKTPNFDEAAATGLRFDHFYAAAPVCSPTRASVMTGRHPNRMGVFKWGYPIRPQEVTIAEVLKDAGYTTAHFGKWHLGSVRNDSPVHPGHNGFDTWLSAPNFYDNDPILSREGKAVQFEGESSMIAADGAIDWMKAQVGQSHPFFGVVWFGSPHNPHTAAEEDRALYADQPKSVQDFYGEITGMDRAFGKLRSALKEMNIRDNTLLWYCSDNGGLPKLGSPGGRGNKADIYEGGLRVPAIMEWPTRISQPRITDVRCNTCDIYPTLLDLLGIQQAHQPLLDGISLQPLIEGTMQTRPKPMGFWDYTIAGIGTPSDQLMSELLKAQQDGGDLPAAESSQLAAKLPEPAYPLDKFPGHSAWTSGDWKLHRIEGKQGKLTWELYNLKDDPLEAHNRLSDEPNRVKTMRTELESWLQSVLRSLNGEDYGRK